MPDWLNEKRIDTVLLHAAYFLPVPDRGQHDNAGARQIGIGLDPGSQSRSIEFRHLVIRDHDLKGIPAQVRLTNGFQGFHA